MQDAPRQVPLRVARSLRWLFVLALVATLFTLASCEFLQDEFVTIGSSGQEFEALLRTLPLR